MSAFSDHVEAVQNLARAVVEISRVDVPELEVTDEMIIEEEHGEWIETDRDEDWWDAWSEIYAIVDRNDGAMVGDGQMRPGVDPHRRFDEVTRETDWTSLVVKVYASGEVDILAEFDTGSGRSWEVLFDGRVSAEKPDAIKLGRQVASAELAILASETGSCADTLDYWQTALSPNAFRQRQWGNIRGVGRQTVNDRRRSAKDTLDIE